MQPKCKDLAKSEDCHVNPWNSQWKSKDFSKDFQEFMQIYEIWGFQGNFNDLVRI